MAAHLRGFSSQVDALVLFDEATYEKLKSEVPKYKMITPSILADRLRINGSLARAAIRELAEEVCFWRGGCCWVGGGVFFGVVLGWGVGRECVRSWGSVFFGDDQAA